MEDILKLISEYTNKIRGYIPQPSPTDVASFLPGGGMTQAATENFPNAKKAYDEARYGDMARETFAGLLGTAGDVAWAAGPVVGASAGSLMKAGGHAVRPVGTTLNSAPKLPKLIEGYHGTSSPQMFDKLTTSEKDMGIHIATDPNVARHYVELHNGPPRTMPVYADVRKPLSLPFDARNWYNPRVDVIREVDDALERSNNFKLPEGMYEDLIYASRDWRERFPELLKQGGYDSVKYPHADPVTMSKKNPPFNSLMILDPEKVIPKFSPKGLTLASERGVIQPRAKLRHNWWD